MPPALASGEQDACAAGNLGMALALKLLFYLSPWMAEFVCDTKAKRKVYYDFCKMVAECAPQGALLAAGRRCCRDPRLFGGRV